MARKLSIQHPGAVYHPPSASLRHCPVCQNPMRVIAVIDDPRVVEKILRHLGAWHDPPPKPPPRHRSGPYTYEPCLDVDPTPDYENVLTD